MPRYRFRFTNSARTSDCGVLELPSDQAAREEAELEACDLLDDGDRDWRHWTVDVSDEAGRHVASVRIGDLQRQPPST